MISKNSCREIREINHKKILRSILKNGEMLRRDLATEHGISVMTVKNVVDELIASDVLQESKTDASIGRKPRVLHIARHYGVIACISLISHDYFSYCIFSIDARVREKRNIIFDKQRSYEENLSLLCEQMRSDLALQPERCIGIGVSVPSTYYEELDRVNHDLIPEFKDFSIAEYFMGQFKLKNVRVMHDVFASAQAEMEALGKKSLFYFYAGFGVGGAFLHEDGWYVGANHMAGEVGRCLVQTDNGPETLENLASIPRLMQDINLIAPGISQYEAFARYDAGDLDIVACINRATDYIAQVLSNIAWTIDPHCIVVNSASNRYTQLIIDACMPYIRANNSSLSMPICIQPALLENSELLGCFNGVLEGFMDEVLSALPKYNRE